VKKNIAFCAGLLAGTLLAATVEAQVSPKTHPSTYTSSQVATSGEEGPGADGSVQTVLSALTTLPEADTLIYINPQRILNEAVPRFMPEKDVADMRSGFNQLKQNVGIDPAKIEYIILAVRFKKPSAGLSFIPPEFMLVAGGDMSADSLLVLARMASGGKLRDEKYGNKTIGLMTVEQIAKQAETNLLLKSFAEIAIVPLNANTIAVGTTAYLKAAVDAAEGKERLSREGLDSLLRDPTVLISAAGSPLSSFKKTFGLLGTETSPRPAGCDSAFGDFYASLTMDTNNFMLRGAMNADNPDTAKIINNLLSGLVQQAVNTVTDKATQSALKYFSIRPQENEIVLSADVPQQIVLDFIKAQAKPKAEVAPTAKPVTRAKKKRMVRRRVAKLGQ